MNLMTCNPNLITLDRNVYYYKWNLRLVTKLE